MADEKMTLALPAALAAELRRLAAALGIESPEAAARLAIEDWTARNREAADVTDADGKYFVNQALDELIARQRK